MKLRPFSEHDLNERLLYSAFLLMVGIGYLMALVYLYACHAPLDGEDGLSVQDIAENYYGNRSGTRLEASLRGSMSAYISLEQRHQVVAWLKSGAGEEGYQQTVGPILNQRCIICHNANTRGGMPDLSAYEQVQKVAQVDTGESLLTLVKVSHIHLLGISLILLSVGMIFRHTMLNLKLKVGLTLAPFAAMLIDIGSWFLTKWDPTYAYVVVFAGGLLGFSLAAQILITLYQIWFYKPVRKFAETDAD